MVCKASLHGLQSHQVKKTELECPGVVVTGSQNRTAPLPAFLAPDLVCLLSRCCMPQPALCSCSLQVTAAGEYWGAEVRILQGVTHDVLLGPQAAAVSEDILSWLETLPPVPVHSKAVDAGIWPRWRGLRNVGDAADASVGRVL